MSLLKSSDAERLDCLTRFCQYSFSCDHHRFSGFLCAIVHRVPPIHSVMLQMLVWLLVVPLVINHVSVLSLLQHQHDGLIRFTPDPEEGSCAIGTVSSELLCRCDS